MEDQDRQRLAAAEQSLAALTARLNALAEGNFELGAEGFRVGSTRLLEKLVGSLYHLHQRDEAGTENDLTDALSIQGVGVSETAPTAAQVLVYDATLDEWVPSAPGTPGAHALGGAAHTVDTLAHLNTKVSDATLDDSGASRTPSAHTVASHSDTTATGAELETLTDGSDADSLHDHGQFTSAAEAIAAVEGEATLDLTGDVTIAAAKSLAVDTINEKTPAAGVIIDGSKLKDKFIYPDAGDSAYCFGKAANTVLLYGDTNDYMGYSQTGDDWQFRIGGNLILDITASGISAFGDILGSSSIFLTEQAAAGADVGAKGQVWVKNTTPNELWFTDDAGTDFQLGLGTGGGQDLATDTLWAAAGDLAKGTGNDTADILSAGASGTFLRINGSVPYWDAPGIASGDPIIVDATDGAPNDDEYARWTASGLEGRTEAQFKSDFNLEDADINTLAVAAVATADDYLKNDANDETTGDLTVANLITAGLVDGLDCSGVAAGADVTADNTPKAHGPAQHTEGTAWRVTYQNAAGDETEVVLGADGTFFQSEGASAAPTFGALQTTDIPDISATYQVVSEKDANSGYAGLEADGAVPVAHGGSGETTVQAAIDILTAVSGATNEHVLTKDTATGNAVFKAAAGGGNGATTALDNLASVAINTSLLSDTDSTDDLGSSAKYWRYGYIDRVYVNDTAYFDGATAGRAALTGDLSISGVLALKGAAPNASFWLNIFPTGVTLTGSNYAAQIAASGTLNAAATFTAVYGATALLRPDEAASGTIYGLRYQVGAATGAVTATTTAIYGAHIRAYAQAINSGTHTVPNCYGLYVADPSPSATGSADLDIQNYYHMYMATIGSAHAGKIRNAYGLYIGDLEGASHAGGSAPTCRILELGPDGAPYMRLLGSGSWTPAANETPLYLAYDGGPTLGQVTLGAADSGGTDYRVLRVPNAV